MFLAKFVFNKSAKEIQWRKDHLSNNEEGVICHQGAGGTEVSDFIEKRISKWILAVRVGESLRKRLQDLG